MEMYPYTLMNTAHPFRENIFAPGGENSFL